MTERAQWQGDGIGGGWAVAQDLVGAVEPMEDVVPAGEVYDWYQRGVQLLDGGNPAAASQVLTRAALKAPRSRSILEALARAQFDAEQYREAVTAFQALADSNPQDDYAQFGWGLAAARLGEYGAAVEHLALAAAMRPDVRYYTQALRGARATVRARSVADYQRPGPL